MTTPKHSADFNDHVPAILAILATLAVMAEMLVAHMVPTPKGNETLVTQIQTGLIGGWMVAMTYYFGTTNNSRKNADTINLQAETARTAGAALAATVGTPGQVELKPGDDVKVSAVEDTDTTP